jgi:hypothetical protein
MAFASSLLPAAQADVWRAWHRQPSRQNDWLMLHKQTRSKPESAP